jgi:hypothetical protein
VSPVAGAVATLSAEIAAFTARFGRQVGIDEAGVLDRSDVIDLRRPGLWSPNGGCRLVRAADGWIAVNLPRDSDLDLIPAWLGSRLDAEPWPTVVRRARTRTVAALTAGAALLGLPVAGVGEVKAKTLIPPLIRRAAGGRPRAALKVVDLSSMWAGPLCGAVLAQAGAAVLKVESRQRPDAARDKTPALSARLNGDKAERALDFAAPADLAWLRGEIAAADVVITSARPRAFAQLDLSPADAFAANPGLVWVAISGYGWTGEAADRVAFGDDAAAAGGLLRWTPRGAPRFAGDALADPLTGLAAAGGALQALAQGGGFLVDAALARTAAAAAA